MKLPSKKLSIITVSALAVVATGAISYASLNSQPKAVVETPTVSNVQQVSEPVATTEVTPVEEATSEPVAPAPEPEPVVDSKYPYATFDGNAWNVTDHTALLASAGIPEADYAFARNAMYPMRFTEDGLLMIGNLQDSVQKQRYGSVATPEDQVRTYSAYVMDRYGSWEQASHMMSMWRWN